MHPILSLGYGHTRLIINEGKGVGVRPTIEVPFDPIYAAGRDPQLDRAAHLSERIKG